MATKGPVEMARPAAQYVAPGAEGICPHHPSCESHSLEEASNCRLSIPLPAQVALGNMTNVSPSLGRDDEMASAALSDALEVLLSFGCAMLNSGDTAFRVREWMEELARKMGFDALSVSFTLSSVTISVRHGSELR